MCFTISSVFRSPGAGPKGHSGRGRRPRPRQTGDRGRTPAQGVGPTSQPCACRPGKELLELGGWRGGGVTNLILEWQELCPAGTPCAPTGAACLSLPGVHRGRKAAERQLQTADLSTAQFGFHEQGGARAKMCEARMTCNYSSPVKGLVADADIWDANRHAMTKTDGQAQLRGHRRLSLEGQRCCLPLYWLILCTANIRPNNYGAPV